MNAKPHRVVSNASGFQRVAHLLNDRAVECAENEGWPVPAEAPEPTLVIVQTSVAQRVAVFFGQHLKREIHFWSGHKEAQHRTRPRRALPSLLLHAQSASP
ncbi:hypothetical protein [Pseudoxanthomonas sp. SE1]|uniref:hypothetical protein n=1 Tax=Pseudoxanthomonas sp. SE1 TaxID=1664560 RepID=UPI00240DA90A|nr:hypothetical protein [Pseudoxanthomonas sp. SE1]WFC42035.1 hypothetical protein OY559_00370 [Pseudoxanthomonas sp. SE1]